MFVPNRTLLVNGQSLAALIHGQMIRDEGTPYDCGKPHRDLAACLRAMGPRTEDTDSVNRCMIEDTRRSQCDTR